MTTPSKRRKTESKTEEITFDNSARHEYLTGFHKRKVQRTKHAQEAAERRAREEKIAERKRLREERKADLERHVQQVNALIRPLDEDGRNEEEDDRDEEADWAGIEDQDPPPVDHEAEYIDEDKYTTVTVETMDISRDGLARLDQDLDESADTDEQPVQTELKKTSNKANKPKSTADKKRREQSKLKKRKKRDFRYESKTDRKVSRMKAKMKNSKQAKARKAG